MNFRIEFQPCSGPSTNLKTTLVFGKESLPYQMVTEGYHSYLTIHFGGRISITHPGVACYGGGGGGEGKRIYKLRIHSPEQKQWSEKL